MMKLPADHHHYHKLSKMIRDKKNEKSYYGFYPSLSSYRHWLCSQQPGMNTTTKKMKKVKMQKMKTTQ